MNLIRRETTKLFLVTLSSPTWTSSLSVTFIFFFNVERDGERTFIFFFNVERDGERAQQLYALTIALASLPDDLGVILSTHMVVHNLQ